MAILLTKGEAQLTMCIQSHTHTCTHRVKHAYMHTHVHTESTTHTYTHTELLNACFIKKLV